MEMKTIITQLLLLAAMPVAAQRLTVAKKTVDCGKEIGRAHV